MNGWWIISQHEVLKGRMYNVRYFYAIFDEVIDNWKARKDKQMQEQK